MRREQSSLSFNDECRMHFMSVVNLRRARKAIASGKAVVSMSLPLDREFAISRECDNASHNVNSVFVHGLPFIGYYIPTRILAPFFLGIAAIFFHANKPILDFYI